MSDDVEVLDQTTMYESHVGVDRVRLRHRQLSGQLGLPIERDMIRVPAAVGILPYDPVRDEIVLIRQFRIGVWGAGEPPWLVESVAGVIDDGEDAEATARRETIEETGCSVSELHFVCAYFPSLGIITERVKLYCGITDTTDAGGNHGLVHEGEDIEAFVKPWDEAWEDVQTGKFFDAKLLLIMMWLSQNKKSLVHGSQNPKEPV